MFAKSMTSSNTEDIQVFLDESIKGKEVFCLFLYLLLLQNSEPKVKLHHEITM